MSSRNYSVLWYDFTMPTTPTFPLAPTAGARSVPLDNITFALRIFLFITCLVENSIAVFILHTQHTRTGRKTFASYMFANMACADILTALTFYPAVFVEFSQGTFSLLVEGAIGDVLCKCYNFFVNLPSNVLIVSLIALACDAIRNSSSKGRKEHTKKFSIIVTISLWIVAAGFSAVYLRATVHTSYQLNKCYSVPFNQMIATVLNMGFMVTVDAVLVFLNSVVLVRVKGRGREMKRNVRKRELGRPPAKSGRRARRRIGVDSADYQPQPADRTSQEMQPTGTRRGCGIEDHDAIEASQQAGPSTSPEIVIGISTINESETAVVGSKTSTVKEVKTQGSENAAGRSSQEGSFQMTRNEAKIMGAVSVPFVILSITELILSLVCRSCSVYLFFAVALVEEIFAVIKPGIYASADKGFRKRYKQLSPFACCCLRRVRRNTVQEVHTRN